VDKYLLKLYIAGQSQKSASLIANLHQMCDEQLSGHYEVVIIDVLEQPQLAEADKILATPTLIKQFPPPVCRIIGDLSDAQKVAQGLGLRPKDNG
jgi:circadian clock protein KaiB